jgi:hypothetical protein
MFPECSLQPANLMIQGTHIVVIDFGYAKRIRGADKCDAILHGEVPRGGIKMESGHMGQVYSVEIR